MDTNELAKAKAARAIAEAQCAKAIEERDVANVYNNAMVAEIHNLRVRQVDLIEENGKLRAALKIVER